MKGFPLKVNFFCNTATCERLKARVLSPRPPPPPLYHGGDITLFVRPGVKWVIHFDTVDFCVKKSTQGEILG